MKQIAMTAAAALLAGCAADGSLIDIPGVSVQVDVPVQCANVNGVWVAGDADIAVAIENAGGSSIRIVCKQTGEKPGGMVQQEALAALM